MAIQKKSLLVIILVGILVLSALACKIASPRSATATAAPVLPPAFTIDPMSTATIGPTATVTPLPAWITNFAEPILQAIGNRPPDYQDDFSSPSSGWQTGRLSETPGPKIAGEIAYLDGEYSIRADGITGNDTTVCSGGEYYRIHAIGDLVAEYDAKFVSGSVGNLQFQFHKWYVSTNMDGQYTLIFRIDRHLGFTKCGPGPECPNVATYLGSASNGYGLWNHFQLIVRGPRLAAYLNGVPVLFWEDPEFTADYKKGGIALTVCNNGPDALEARWDNLRIWDISNLP